MNQLKQNTIKLETFEVSYFTTSGKYYTSGYFSCNVTVIQEGDVGYCLYMQDAVDCLKKSLLNGLAPGLISWNDEFYVYINHKDGYPVMIIPDKLKVNLQ